jgi:hypothetical protein
LILVDSAGASAAPFAVRAQEADESAPGKPVAEQMRRLFAARLRSDVGLDDAQVAAVLPQIESLERSRAQAARQRRVLVRELRHGLADGMPDAELQSRLDALDRIGQDGERAARATLADVDRALSVPQRVRLRFLLVQFRREMMRRVDEIRQGDGSAPRRSRHAAPPVEPSP